MKWLHVSSLQQHSRLCAMLYPFGRIPNACHMRSLMINQSTFLQVSQNPFQSTLPGDGNGQTLVTLGPCSGNTVHTHPRGSEISFVTYGNIVSCFIPQSCSG